MIREAVHSDIPRLMDLAKHFHALIEYPADLDLETVESVLGFMIQGETAFILVDDEVTGAIGVYLFPMHFNANNVISEANFHWSLTPMLGARLLVEAEDIAKKHGATHMHMSVLQSAPKVGKLYDRHGYSDVEKTMAKVL